MYCVACSTGNACTACVGGYVKDGKCTAFDTTVVKTDNCGVYNSSGCLYCLPNFGRASATSCVAYPTTKTPTECGIYRWDSALTTPALICTGCLTKSVTTAAASAGTATMFQTTACHATETTTSIITNCSVLEATAALTAASSTTSNTKCIMCATGYSLNSASTGSCVANPTTGNLVGCGQFSDAGTTCEWCNPSTHQMAESQKCSAKPTAAYSAILSVVSMIVALMFANF